jgi:ribosome-associated protein YbcJ (S4-like RNA binding protein)
MSNFCTYLVNGEVYNRKRSIVSAYNASCFFAVRPYHKQNTVYLNYQDQTRRNIKMQVDIRVKFLLHFPTLPTIGMCRQILITIPNMKFYENPWG